MRQRPPMHSPEAHPPEVRPPAPGATTIEAMILSLVTARGREKSICPSEVARALTPGALQEGWQSLMTPIRQAASRLSRAGQIDILRKGRPVPPEDMRGVIRLRLKAEA